MRIVSLPRLLVLVALCSTLFSAAPSGARDGGRRFPNILVISVDTLRLDRLSIYGYERPTSPYIDLLLRGGARFEEARTPEPLTAPAMVSTFTSLHPHEHGASRNGLRMRPELPSWPKALKGRGYKVAAFVGNWTLKDEISGLGEHFEVYEEVLNRKRWGLFLGEATAEDLNKRAVSWLDRHQKRDGDWPFLLWLHYVEPHAPYRFRPQTAPALGIKSRDKKSDRYDTEVAYVDRAVGRLLSDVRMRVPMEDLLIVFLADHGESLGEHGYWGHGRNLFEQTLRVPMGIVWDGKIPTQQVVGGAATLLDIGPTVLGLLGLEVPMAFQGKDWTGHLVAGQTIEPGRVTFHQAHKGAVQRRKNNDRARRAGLLEVGLVRDGKQKELLTVKTQPAVRSVFDLNEDSLESVSLEAESTPPSSQLEAWLTEVRQGLEASDLLPPPTLDEESLEQLKALGYID